MDRSKSGSNALEELRQIDVSAIAELVRIKSEEQVLNERLTRMEGSRLTVSAAVYGRVRADYESRLAALAVQSRPLKERARREYAKLRALSAEVNRVADEAALEKEELEFRRELGEFRAEEFRKRLQECEKYLDGRQQELAEIDQLRQQFLHAVHDESELEGPAPPAERGPATPPPPAPPAAPAELAGESARIEAPLPKVSPAPNIDATVVAPAPRSERDSTLPAGVPISAGAPTARLAAPRIVRIEDGRTAAEYILKRGTTSIGRSPKNGIVLPSTEISRHHADIVFAEDGYRIVDSGAGNGVVVNGKQVKEHVLRDGDTIQIGMQKLLFKE